MQPYGLYNDNHDDNDGNCVWGYKENWQIVQSLVAGQPLFRVQGHTHYVKIWHEIKLIILIAKSMFSTQYENVPKS